MAVYNFSNGATISGFVVGTDVLSVDATTFGSASGFTFNTSGADLVLTASNGQTATLSGVTIQEITDSNVVFSDGSQLLIGDNTTDAFADASANTITTSSNTGDNAWGFEGADTIAVDGTGAHYVQGHSGADGITISSASGEGTGNNTVRGGADIDTITLNSTGTGNNEIKGDAGADIISISGTGTNFIRGGADNDTIDINAAATGVNTVWGDLGQDNIDVNGNGANTINGGGGIDTIDVSDTTATTGANFVRGGADNDVINIGSGAAASGNNTVWGDLGDDSITLTTATGNNTVYGDNVNNLTDSGADTISLTATATGANLINGMNGNDSITGAIAAAALLNTIRGGAGDDTITITDDGAGFANGLSLRGDNGDDTFSVTLDGNGASATTIEGGAGADTFTLNVSGNLNATTGAHVVTISDFDGTEDVVNATLANESAALLSVVRTSNSVQVSGTATDDETIIFSNITGNLSATNFVLSDSSVLATNYDGAAATLTGSANDDQLIAGDNGDTLVATAAGSDKVTGGAGADTIQVVATVMTTADTIDGGSGTDVIQVTGAAGAIADADFTNVSNVEELTFANVDQTGAIVLDAEAYGAGIRTVDASALTGANGLDNIDITAGFDANIVVVGGAGSNNVDASLVDGGYTASLTGGASADTLAGGAGNDTISGGDGNDAVLTGAAGTDSINGGAGTDTITGGDGNDTLTGGSTDADTFVFGATAAANDLDTITDFDATDLLDFGAFVTDTTITSTQADSGTSAVVWANEAILVVTDADGSINTAAEVAALFGAGSVFADAALAADEAVLLIQGGGQTTVWYIDEASADTTIDVGEVTQVATLSGYTTSLVDADFT